MCIDVLHDENEVLRDDFAQMSMGRMSEIVGCRAAQIPLRLVVRPAFFKFVAVRIYLSLMTNLGAMLVMGHFS